MISAGTADWQKPVRIADDQWRANFKAYLVTRYTLDDGRQFHVKTRYSGVDDIITDGTVTGGFGHIEGEDVDGDLLYGRVGLGRS